MSPDALGPRSLADEARRYARRGWAVFPIAPKSKAPLIRSKRGGRGFMDASTDEDRVTRWWAREPQANIGIATGEPSGIVVLDVDDFDSLEALEATHGDLETLWAVTGSGGMHFVFRRPKDGLRNSAGRVAPGIDVRGDGGYIVAAPSVHPSGQPYRWGLSGPIEPAHMPEWLLTLARPKARPSVPREHRRQPPSVTVEHGATVYGATVLRGEAKVIAWADEGERNETLNRCAYRVGRFVAGGEIEEDRARDVLMDAATASGLPEMEAERTIVGALIAAEVDPLTAPRRDDR